MIEKIMDETNTGFMSHNGGLDLRKIDENNLFIVMFNVIRNRNI